MKTEKSVFQLKRKGGKSNQTFTCSRAIWNHVFAMRFKRFAWFVCVVLTAKNTSSNRMAVGFGVTVPASIVIRLLNSFVVTSFNHGNCVGVKFPLNPSKSPLDGCDLGASKTWNKRRQRDYFVTTRFCIDSSFGSSVFIIYCLVFYVDWIIYVCRWRSHPLCSRRQF